MLPSGVILFDAVVPRKKQTLPEDGRYATSPLPNSERGLSTPESSLASMYGMLPSRWAWPSTGSLRSMAPTVLGERWRFRLHPVVPLPCTSKKSSWSETDANPLCEMIRLYNVLRGSRCLSSSPKAEGFEVPADAAAAEQPEDNAGLEKALDTYRKLVEKRGGDMLGEKEQAELERKLEEIKGREIVERIGEREPKEIPCVKNKITIGPPTLTRFEKARIMGARALQLSLGAPPFIPIPKTARISLDISMEELDRRVIPIIIRRVLPNGDYQNIPIEYFVE